MTHQPVQTLENSLRPGWYLYWRKQIHQITAVHPDDLLIKVSNIETAENQDISLSTLLTDCQDDSAALHVASSLDALHAKLGACRPRPEPADALTLPPHLLARADAIIATVETVERLAAQEERSARLRGEPFQRTEALQRALGKLDRPIALSTFYKYRRLIDQSGGNHTQLAASLRRSTFNQTRRSRAELHLLDTLILRYYARRRPIRPATLYRLAQTVVRRTGSRWIDPARCGPTLPEDLVEELLTPSLPVSSILENTEKRRLLTEITLPSQSWFYAYLRWFEHQPDQGKHVITARYGREVWEREHLVFDTYASLATFPLQYVFADHYLLDLFVVDEDTRSLLNRLWLTVLIDVYSRSILGMALLYEVPSIMSIQSALHHAIWPKTSHKALGIQGEWVCFGIPQQLSLDNAWAHHSHSLEDLARAISQGGRFNSIDLLFRPPYRGRYGALVERFLGSLAGQLKEHLPGAILSSQPHSVRSAAREACLLYQDIDHFIQQVIVTYQHTVHGELDGMTPHEKWVEGLQSGIPLVPPLTPEVDRLFWRMSPHSRVITGKGISAFGMDYWSPDLSRAERVGRNGQRIRYSFRYDPADISRLALFRDGTWVGDLYAKQLRQPDGALLSVGLAERDLAQKMARHTGQSAQDWLQYIYDIDELSRVRQRERRAATRKLGHGASSSHLTPGRIQDTEDVPGDVSLADVYQNYTVLLAGFLGSAGLGQGEE